MPENGDRDSGVKQLEAYLDEHPDSDRFAELAEHLVEEGRPADAIKVCERGIGFHPDLAAGHLVYGKALVSLESLDEGIQSFERACMLRKRDVGMFAEVGQFLADSGQREAAFPYLEKGQDINAKDPRIMHLEAKLSGPVPADHERIETKRMTGDGEPSEDEQPEQAQEDEEEEPPGQSWDDDAEDDEALRVPTDRISWPAWESQPPPPLDAFATEDDQDKKADFEPPTVYTQNPLAAKAAQDSEDEHPPLSAEFESAETVEVAEAEELAKEIERQQQETVLDAEAGLTAEVSEAVNQAAAPPSEPPTMFDPSQAPQPWAEEEAGTQERAGEPPTMFDGAQAAESDTEPPPTQYTGSPGGAVVSYHQAVAEPAEHFSYLKVFLVLVPFLVVGLGLGGYVAYRHIRTEKINKLLDQVLTSISRDTFLSYSDSKTTVDELLQLDDEHPRGRALAALISARLHDEYGPNVTLKEEGQRILEQEKVTPQNGADLLWTRFHLRDETEFESDLKRALEKSPKNPRLLGLAGEAAVIQGKTKEAMELFERSLAEQPSSVRTLYTLARLEVESGKAKKAIEHLERALAINGIHVRSLIALSSLRLQHKTQLDRAKTDLEKILELPQVTSKRRAESHFLLGKLFFERFERTRAVAEVKAASELLPDDTQFQIRLARLCSDYYELDEVVKRTGKVLESSPDNMETRILLIGSDLPRGRIQKVKKALNQLIGKKVPASAFLVLRGEALLLSGQYGKALSDLTSVKPTSPHKPRARALAVLARLGTGDTEKAYRAAKALLKDHPAFALTHFALGQYRLSKRMRASAATSFKMAVELDPRCYQALTLLAHLSNEERKAQQAEELATLALRANPHAVEARKLLGRLRIEKGDAKGALDAFARVVYELGSSQEGLVGMAEALLMLNQTDKALKAIEKAREAGASDAHAYHVEGRIHLARGKFFPAVRALTKAKRKEDKHPEILADLGLAQLGARSLTKAERTLKDSLKRRRLLRAQEGLAKVYRERRKYKDAAQAFHSAAYLANKKGWKPEEIAELYMEGGKAWLRDTRTKSRHARARNLFRKAAKLVPNDVLPLYMVAEAFDRDEKLPLARRAYMDVLKLDPNHSQALYRLGLIEYDEGSDKKAKEYFERFLKTGAKGKDAARARKLLGKIK